MAVVPTLGYVVLDCPDPQSLAEFYAAVLEWPAPKAHFDGEWVTVDGPSGMAIAFQRVADYRAPEWPSQVVPQQFHLDLNVTDLDAGQERVEALGARLLDDKPATFRVFADPVGHPFCLCAC